MPQQSELALHIMKYSDINQTYTEILRGKNVRNEKKQAAKQSAFYVTLIVLLNYFNKQFRAGYIFSAF